jgi:tripartite-type tricarboxylate transporter receptor subunit TctC
MRALAVTSAKRNPAMPELPTVAEAGVPGYEFDTWLAAAHLETEQKKWQRVIKERGIKAQ